MGLDIHLYNVYKRIYCSLQVVLRSWSIKTKFPFPVNIGLAMLFAEHWLIQSKKISLKSAIDRVDRWIHKTTRFFHLIRKINDLTAICNLYFLSSPHPSIEFNNPRWWHRTVNKYWVRPDTGMFEATIAAHQGKLLCARRIFNPQGRCIALHLLYI